MEDNYFEKPKCLTFEGNLSAKNIIKHSTTLWIKKHNICNLKILLICIYGVRKQM